VSPSYRSYQSFNAPRSGYPPVLAYPSVTSPHDDVLDNHGQLQLLHPTFWVTKESMICRRVLHRGHVTIRVEHGLDCGCSYRVPFGQMLPQKPLLHLPPAFGPVSSCIGMWASLIPCFSSPLTFPEQTTQRIWNVIAWRALEVLEDVGGSQHPSWRRTIRWAPPLRRTAFSSTEVSVHDQARAFAPLRCGCLWCAIDTTFLATSTFIQPNTFHPEAVRGVLFCVWGLCMGLTTATHRHQVLAAENYCFSPANPNTGLRS